jgi:hypothetical protein
MASVVYRVNVAQKARRVSPVLQVFKDQPVHLENQACMDLKVSKD